VGCNQSFLDFYGFSSQDELVGKNDEDMGWHVNPVPYMNDELRVLNEGASTCNEPGQCIVRGQLHDIVASKQPVYDNGRIVGLVGCFFDASGPTPQSQAVARTPHIDKVTDMLTYTGLESAVMRYIEAYQRSGTDFSMLILEIERFRRMNILFGYEFGDKVLRAVADTIRNIAGTSCVTGRIFADRFVVLLQGMSDSEVDALAQRIIAGLEAISQVDGTPCTIFASFLRVRYSEAGSARELRRIANLSSEDIRSWNA
jgi:diguanylate cyclase (GGDEF)-like protein